MMLFIGTYLAAQLMSRYKDEFESAKNAEERELLLAWYAEVMCYLSMADCSVLFYPRGPSDPCTVIVTMNGQITCYYHH